MALEDADGGGAVVEEIVEYGTVGVGSGSSSGDGGVGFLTQDSIHVEDAVENS